jgi:hypothetical protein
MTWRPQTAAGARTFKSKNIQAASQSTPLAGGGDRTGARIYKSRMSGIFLTKRRESYKIFKSQIQADAFFFASSKRGLSC